MSKLILSIVGTFGILSTVGCHYNSGSYDPCTGNVSGDNWQFASQCDHNDCCIPPAPERCAPEPHGGAPHGHYHQPSCAVPVRHHRKPSCGIPRQSCAKPPVCDHSVQCACANCCEADADACCDSGHGGCSLNLFGWLSDKFNEPLCDSAYGECACANDCQHAPHYRSGRNNYYQTAPPYIENTPLTPSPVQPPQAAPPVQQTSYEYIPVAPKQTYQTPRLIQNSSHRWRPTR